MSDTPETDAFYGELHPDAHLLEHARSLERRLREAHDMCDRYAEQLQAALREVEEHKRDAERWRWSKDILSGEDDADAKTALVAAGLMRNETINQIIDAALAEKGKP